MKRILFTSLCIAAIFSFFACKIEDSDSSIQFSVASPQQSSEHGYNPSDLVSCTLEFFTSDGKSYFYNPPFNSSFAVSSLKSGQVRARAYGYDSFGSAIALSSYEEFTIKEDSDMSQIMQLEWYESGKEENAYCYVKFDCDGGTTVAQQKVRAGDHVSKPETPVRGDWNFEGWYWNSARTVAFDFSEPVSWNLTLHAKWSGGTYENEEPEDNPGGNNNDDPNNGTDNGNEDTYSISFYRNDGTNQKNEWRQLKDSNFSFPDGSMFGDGSDGKYFLGWVSDSSISTPEYFSGDNYGSLTSDLSFYAVWTDEGCTVTVVNSYDSTEYFTRTVGKNSKISLYTNIDWSNPPWNKPESYTMCGFATSSVPDDSEFVDSPLITSDMTYYAIWGYWIVFHENWFDDQGNEIRSWRRCVYGKSSASMEYTPYHGEDTAFLGWYTDETLSEPVDFSAISASQGDSYAQIHIYAKWKEKSATGISVTMESIGGDANPGLSLDSSTGTFTAASGFSSYLWKLDGVLAPSTLNTFSVDVSATSTLSAGVHNVLLVVTDSDGNSYSATATIKIER